MCFKILLVPKIVAYFRCLFFIMSVHSHICTYSTYILNTYIHNDLWQCICVLMICFLAKKIITLYPVRVRISLKKRRLRFFFWNLPFGQVSFFFFRNLPPPRLRFFWPISLEVSFFERGFVFNIQPNTYGSGLLLSDVIVNLTVNPHITLRCYFHSYLNQFLR